MVFYSLCLLTGTFSPYSLNTAMDVFRFKCIIIFYVSVHLSCLLSLYFSSLFPFGEVVFNHCFFSPLLLVSNGHYALLALLMITHEILI